MSETPVNEALLPVFQRLIGRSPPGQLCDVLAGCRQLAGASALPPELTVKACMQSNEASLLVLPLVGATDGRRGIVCDFARMGSRSLREVVYLDPRTDMVFSVDHERQECTDLRPKPQGSDIKAEMQKANIEAAKPFQEALQLELDRYVAGHFPAADGAACGCAYINPGKDSDSVELRVYLSSQRARPQGYWAGTWTSQWRVVFAPGQRTAAKLGGIIEFRSSYSEDGNVQLRRKATRIGEVSQTADSQRFAFELVAAIARFEEDFHLNTEDTCETYGAGTLKAMRRLLPLAKERFDWRPIRHSLVRDMKAASKEVA
mmetsp:Transcript_41404/g.128706  ORF Transcript_41404/g.128706 Transcript_41404/m.128706 type:complete len:317 (-) Transcript_41404:147-1097(-)